MPSSRSSSQQNETRALRVYGWNRHGRQRCIVAAGSWAEAAQAAGGYESAAVMRKYGAITANGREICVAMERPGKVFARPISRPNRAFLPLNPEGSE